MPAEWDLRALARRVVGRVLAERGRTEHLAGRPVAAGVERQLGVHVHLAPGGEPLRPEHESEARSNHGPAAWITAEALRGVADGAVFALPRGARVTELAREEAWRRRIALVEGRAGAVETRREDGRVRIALGADHGGFALKQELIAWLGEQGHVTIDLGTRDENAVDYPDFARAVAETIARGGADVGICVDGAGIGSAMAANKVPGVRAANGWNVASAKNAREHNFANVLTLGARMVERRAAREIVEAFLATPWGGERHARRIEKIDAIERSYASSHAPTARRER